MGKNSCRARDHMFTIVGTIDKCQHWHGKSYHELQV
jgi:hypothetical protein